MDVYKIRFLERAGMCHCVTLEEIEFIDEHSVWSEHWIKLHLEEKGFDVVVEKIERQMTTSMKTVITLGRGD